MTDRVLAERFHLTRLVGRGGMAEVYAAHDLHLDRDVAVKILLPRFSDDEGFQDRFTAEGRRAASLNHPNTVTVLDTGVDPANHLHYIVMELVQGRSLQDAIKVGGLTEQRALEVCAEVCGALQHAHEQGLVHRDVKPGNILLADDGSVKVTDFGIARAIDSDSNVTQTAAVLGTAAYLSPEQAQGHPVDARSDVYSLGVVLYELLTGHQPFQGDTAVTVAYQHVQEPPRAPRDLLASISPAAEAICMRAMAKNPANRYQTAAELRDDLLRALAGRAIAAPAVLRAEETALLDPVDPDRAPVSANDERRRRLVGYLALGIGSVISAALVVYLLLSSLGGGGSATRSVPDVTGRTLEQAESLLRNQGLEPIVIDDIYSDEVEAGRVARQRPSASTRVADGSTVQLFLSRGPEQIAVPEIEGLSEEDARAALTAAGLRLGERSFQSDPDTEEGTVLRSEPAGGTLVAKGARINLVISAGQELVRVRRVELLSEADATLSLEQQGFEVLVIREFSDTIDAGFVISQDPEPGTELERGSDVTLVVSNGPEAQPTPSASPSPSPSPSTTPSPSQTPTPSETATTSASPSPQPSSDPSGGTTAVPAPSA